MSGEPPRRGSDGIDVYGRVPSRPAAIRHVAVVIGLFLTFVALNVIQGRSLSFITPSIPVATAIVEASTPRSIDFFAVDEGPRYPEDLPPAGVVPAGWYTSGPVSDAGFGFEFKLSTTGWTSHGPDPEGRAGSLIKGVTGRRDGIALRFGTIDRVYTDPCAPTLGPRIGRSVPDLTDALVSLPWVTASEPTQLYLRSSSATYLVLTVPVDLPCAGSSVPIWHGPNGPRSTTPGATVRTWIFVPNDRLMFGRIVIDAETAADASPETISEIEGIVSSVVHGG